MSVIKKVGFGVVLLLAVLVANGEAGKKANTVSSEQLGGDTRYLIYVGTDKPIYRAEETVYLRATFLNAADNTPLSSGSVDINVQIKGPKGSAVFNGYANGDDSAAGLRWDIPAGTPGGQYTALVSSQSIGAPQTERKFEIRAYRAPRLKTQIEFTRDGYGPGEQVQASVKINRAEGGVPKGAKVTVVARVDGEEFFNKSGYTVPDDGLLSVNFDLPKSIEIGDGTLAFVIKDGGVVETASKTMPILLRDLDIEFYPEGGDLVAGLASRVYLQARRPGGKPIDVSGRVFEVSADDEILERVTEVNTQHEGRGIFSLTPKAGQRYALLLDKPSGFTQRFYLPKVKTSGTVITSSQAVFGYDEKVVIGVKSNGNKRPSKLTLHKREALLDSVAVADGVSELSINPNDAEGVLIATVWSANGEPLAERLIYRAPKFAVDVELSVGEGPFVPGGDVTLDILTTDANGKPIEAVVGVTVTDDAILELIDKREQAPRLPVMVYLENEVTDLADAHVYLDKQNSNAPAAVDLLLGTQGWRRFILLRYDEIKLSMLENAQRVMAQRSSPRIAYNDAFVLEETVVAAAKETKQRRVDRLRQEPEPEVPVEAIAAKGELVEFDQAENAADQQNRQFKLARDQVGREQVAAPPVAYVVREYAHQVRANRKPNDRLDFTETLYWHKGIRTSARDGKAQVTFSLSDSVTTFKVMGDAFGRNGALGMGDSEIQSVEPFYIEPKMPLEASVGDIIEVPIALVNASKDDIDAVSLLAKADGLNITQAQAIALDAGERLRQTIRIVASKPGNYPLVLSAAAGVYADRVTRTLRVKANGFPVSETHGGLLGPKTGFTTEVLIPDSLEAGSLNAVAKVYPSPLANMEEALNALLRQPYGCFEQTSSTNYPLVMAQQYFTSHQGIDPEKISKAKDLLNAGYQKLIGFESEDNGYEWFGANPAHEALTAYGLMEFVDMAKIMPVDDVMIQRTRQWLLERRDGKGGFKRNDKAIDSFGRAPAPTTNAYIVWSLLESGESPATLTKEIAAVKADALTSKDSYTVALAANILFLSGDSKAANELSAKLAEAVTKDGAVGAAITSITQSGGDALLIETTSLTLLAWLKNDSRWAAQVETSMKWLFERSKSGRFGSTQSTILALKAINAYDQARAKPKKSGSVQLIVDGMPFGKPVKFDKNSKGAIELPDFSAALTRGEHTLGLSMQDGSDMPFALEVNYHSTLPSSDADTGLNLSTKLSNNKVVEGEPLEMQVTVSVADKVAPTPIAIVGIPAGLEVRHDQLKELVAADRVSSYEVVGRELILYWRALRANEQRVIPVDLTATIPGVYTGPASRAYLYYTDEEKHWVGGHKITVNARR